MKAVRVAFWSFVRNVLDDVAAWAWIRHQTALHVHCNPMSTLKTYQRVAKWRQKAQLRLTAARLGR